VQDTKESIKAELEQTTDAFCVSELAKRVADLASSSRDGWDVLATLMVPVEGVAPSIMRAWVELAATFNPSKAKIRSGPYGGCQEIVRPYSSAELAEEVVTREYNKRWREDKAKGNGS
jgi:hypothetical protein